MIFVYRTAYICTYLALYTFPATCIALHTEASVLPYVSPQLIGQSYIYMLIWCVCTSAAKRRPTNILLYDDFGVSHCVNMPIYRAMYLRHQVSCPTHIRLYDACVPPRLFTFALPICPYIYEAIYLRGYVPPPCICAYVGLYVGLLI